MVEFFENINPWYCYIISGFFIFMIVINVLSYKKDNNLLFLMLAFICFGLFYDTFITGIGYHLQHLFSFYMIGMLRHIFHGLLTPLVLVFCYNAATNCGVFLHKNYRIGVYAITSVLIISAGVAIFTSPVKLIDYGGVIRHSIDKENAFILSRIVLKWLSFGTLIPMGIASYVTIKKVKDYNFFLATLGMFIFSIIGVIIDPELIFMISFIGESILVYFFYKYLIIHG